MNKFCFMLIGCLLVSTTVCQSPYGLYADLLLGLSDQALFDTALAGRTYNCRVTRGASTAACDLYATAGLASGTFTGLPDLYGSGCVVAPDFPKRVNTCFPAPNTYPNYNSTPTPICTGSGVKNAANMIRIAINRGWCRLPICIGYPTCPVLVGKATCIGPKCPVLEGNVWLNDLWTLKYLNKLFYWTRLSIS